MEKIGAAALITWIILMLSFIVIIGGYEVIKSYNERKECQSMGIPLYRCRANSTKVDAEIKVDN